MKRLLSLALALAMLATCVAVASAETTLAPATFSIWTWLGAAEEWKCESYNEILCFQEAGKATNTTINWEIQSDTNTFDLMMSTGDTTDGIYYAWNPARTAQYAAAGLIQDISPYIPTYMPNLHALIESDPLVKKQLTAADGGIYYVPWITADSSLLFGEGFGIRQDWLDKFNLPMPETAEAFYAALKAFRDGDANGNGLNDEIITGYPPQVNRTAYAFGTADDWHYLMDGKTVVYGPATDNYRDWLRFMSKLYADGILDPDYFSWDSDLYMKKAQENRVSAYVDNPGVFGTMMKDGLSNGITMNYVPMPYMQYNGVSTNMSAATRRYVQPYGVTVTTSCKDVGRFLQYFDWMFTQEGNDIMNWGMEGVSFAMDNGERVYTDAVLNDPQYEAGTALSKYAHPSFVGIQSAEARKKLFTDLQNTFIATWADSDNALAIEPFLAFTPEETETNALKQTDLKTSYESWRDKFITGERNIETEWEAYLAELNAYGLGELQAIRQAASDRYMAK